MRNSVDLSAGASLRQMDMSAASSIAASWSFGSLPYRRKSGVVSSAFVSPLSVFPFNVFVRPLSMYATDGWRIPAASASWACDILLLCRSAVTLDAIESMAFLGG